jgi:hypothetical protein
MTTELKIPSGGILVRIMPADFSPTEQAQSQSPADVTPQRTPVTTQVLKMIKKVDGINIYPVEEGIDPISPEDDTWFYADEQKSNAKNWKIHKYKPRIGQQVEPEKMQELVGKYTYFNVTSYKGGRRSSLRNNYKKSVRRVKSAKRASRSASRKYRNRK